MKFKQKDGELKYKIAKKEKLTIWWNAEEDLVEFQIISDGGNSSMQDDLVLQDDMTNTSKDRHFMNCTIKQLSKEFDIGFPKLTKDDYKYLYT